MGSASPAKVLLLIPHLGGGGAEHVTATLAQYLSSEKYEIHLGLVTQCSYEVKKGQERFRLSVHVYPLGARRIRWSAWKLLKLVWRIRPDVILSGMAHLNLLVLLLRPFFPHCTSILVRQNGALAATLEAGKHPRLSCMSFRLAYRRANQVICQTSSMADELQNVLGVDPERLLVLPNPVDLGGLRASTAQNHTVLQLPGPRLLTVARLAPEKGVDLLLKAFAQIKGKFPSAELQVAGTGPYESALKAQCSALGIASSVQFAGHVEYPTQLFPDASVFVLASRHEGLPNALLEAAAAGLPIVATPASQGLTDLLKGRPGVWLARDVSAAALESAISDAIADLQSGLRFEHTWVEPFDLKVAIRAYEDEIDRLLVESRA
jgi:glycosyltransferase involved in cell wall biosynthesis